MPLKARPSAFAIFALTCAGCTATAAALIPPPPGPDIYKCVGSAGDVRYLRIRPGAYQAWAPDATWSVNFCNEPEQSCTTDSSGRITVRQVSRPLSSLRLDTISTYDLPAGRETQQAINNGKLTSESQSRCTPLT
jgi:hypothetical protein